MKNKHYEMIVAKAANMELVVFVKTCDNGAWYEKCDSACQWWEDSEYFLCLPQHKEACLHWLNGGDVQLQDFPTNDFNDYLDEKYEWSLEIWWMSEQCNIRIKPKKEKRWIIWDLDNDSYHCVLKKNPEGRYLANFNFQVLEVELDING